MGTLCAKTHTRASVEGTLMLHYAVVFFVIALIAALFGFGGIAASAGAVNWARMSTQR